MPVYLIAAVDQTVKEDSERPTSAKKRDKQRLKEEKARKEKEKEEKKKERKSGKISNTFHC